VTLVVTYYIDLQSVHGLDKMNQEIYIFKLEPNLIKLLGTYLGALLFQINGARSFNKRVIFYKIGPKLSLFKFLMS